VKHAGASTFNRLAPLLTRLREMPGLVERRPGVFYLRSRAFLHFHDDPTGDFADVRQDGQSFTRLPASSADDWAALLALVAAVTRQRR